jgi:hypothetical protein
MNLPEFKEFEKIPRLKRACVITEKIDGTNAQVYIAEDGEIYAGSRTRWITPENDNYGFAKWVYNNKVELMKLGLGHHFGEWWGAGIQRSYGQETKHFSLFNTAIWDDTSLLPACVSVVPVLYYGKFSSDVVEACLERLKQDGSVAAPGFLNPEGIVIYHAASRGMFKVTIENDDTPKSKI